MSGIGNHLPQQRPGSGLSDTDVLRIRQDFPILQQQINAHPLVYLDNAATSQKPQVVIDTLSRYFAHYNANVHRGIHALSERATQAYEAARDKVRKFLHAHQPEEIVFVRGTTEAINLVAQSYARPRLTDGDEILITAMEHHSNIVPWQILCQQTGAVLRVAPINRAGELIPEAFEALLNRRTRLVALGHISNALGTINPVKTLIDIAHRQQVPVLLDGAQAVPHLPVDVQALDCDFYAFSGHKLYAPTGIGVLYGKKALLDAMPPYQGGGEMIRRVSFSGTEYNSVPHKFEAGTPDIGGVIALGAAIDYISDIGIARIADYEQTLLAHAMACAAGVTDLQLVGTARHKAGIFSFNLAGVHAHDVGTILDQQGVAIRAGHHCAMPVMEFFGVAATARASFAFYNTHDEVDRLFAAIDQVREVMH